ncbi:MAG: hypothetical protein ACJ77L_07105 [Solirubrobacteraceae bacterium]
MPALSFAATQAGQRAALDQVFIATVLARVATAVRLVPFDYDKQNLQREQKRDVPRILTTLGCLAVLALAQALLGLVVWGLMRVDRSYRDPSSGPPPERARRPATTTPGRVARVM